MNLTTVRIASEDGQTRTKNVELNEFIVQGGLSPYKSIKLNDPMHLSPFNLGDTIGPIYSFYLVYYLVEFHV